MQAAHLDLDQAVDVRAESGRMVIEPAQRKEYDLAELVKQITVENLHDQADFGRPVSGMVMVRSYGPDAGDIVWVSCNPLTGHEQAGQRSAAVLSPAALNLFP
jgi:antitoxin component of MazEF toxin-antitoxin module